MIFRPTSWAQTGLVRDHATKAIAAPRAQRAGLPLSGPGAIVARVGPLVRKHCN